MLLDGLMILGVCATLFAAKKVISLLLTLLFSLLMTALSIWSLWNPAIDGWTTAYLALTPLRSWFLLILGIVSVAASWYRFGYRQHDERATLLWLPLFLVSMVGVIGAQNVWIFMTAWELMSITSFFLVIVHHDRPGVLNAGYVYLVMSQFSAVAILSGLLLMASSVHSIDFAVFATTAHSLPLAVKSWIFGLLGLGFAVKSGIVPFHIWLPRAHPIAPAPVSGLMSGAMIKLGIFGITQFLLFDLGRTSVIWPVVLLLFGAISSLLGVLYALMEHDLKRLLAYHSIENIGIIFLGLGVMGLGIDWNRPVLETIGMLAALFHTFNHAVFKSQLFLVAGAVEQHTGTLDADHLGGLVRTIPGITVGFLAGSMAISALPPFNGFISEWITFRGLLSMTSHQTGWWTVFGLGIVLVLAMTSALAGMCFVKASGVIFLGQPRKTVRHDPIPRSMTWPIIALAFLCLALGVFPNVATHVIANLNPEFAIPNTLTLAPVHAATIAFLLFVVILIVGLLSRFWQVRTVPRWSCGRIPDASMQFTSASFTKAVRTTLAVIYRPHRNLTRIGDVPRYFPERLIYKGGTTPIWERYLYRPGYRLAWWLSHHSTRLQAGPVRLYLTYLLVTVGILLLLLH